MFLLSQTPINSVLINDDLAELIEELISDVPKLGDADLNLGSVQDSESYKYCRGKTFIKAFYIQFRSITSHLICKNGHLTHLIDKGVY